MSEENLKQEVLGEIKRLAFGKSNDAVKLAFLKEDETEILDKLDLRSLASIHRLSNGTVELKLIDRLKLLELLLAAAAEQEQGREGAESFIAALDRASARLREETAEDDELS